MLRIYLMLGFMVGAGCSAQTAVVNNSRPQQGKAVAPVEVQTALAVEQAEVTVRLDEDAQAVSVDVWGIDGVSVRGAHTFATKLEKRGQSESFTVALEHAGPGATVVVSVEGVFHGAKLTRVVTAAFRSGAASKRAPVETNDVGEVLKVKPLVP